MELKKNPIQVFKICLILVGGVFLFNIINVAMAPRVQAQGGPGTTRNAGGEKIIPGTILVAPAAGVMERYAVEEGRRVVAGTVLAYIRVNNVEQPLTTGVKGIVRFYVEPGAQFEAKAKLAEMEIEPISLISFIKNIAVTTGLHAFITGSGEGGSPRIALTPAGESIKIFGWQELLMVIVGFVVVYLGAVKGFEPILLIPIGFGIIFVNIPGAGMGDPGIWNEELHIFEHQGFLNIIYNAGVGNEFFPLLIFIGIGAMTDFGPLIANPKTALLGAAAQFGVFGTLFGITLANKWLDIPFNLKEACAVAIIGGADGPTTIYIAAKLASHLLATVAVAAYSYMALVPLIQPPIMKALTTRKERLIKMRQLRPVSRTEKIVFPMVVFGLSLLLIPPAAPIIGCLMFGNFIREIGVVERLSNTAQNDLMNIVSLFLSLGVGSQMTPERFLNSKSLIIVVMGLLAFGIATAAGVLVAKFMNLFLKEKINPLIGSAGVSAVPMAARVSNKVGLEEDPGNFLLMHAMGPNVAGVIGTAIAAGVMIAVYGG